MSMLDVIKVEWTSETEVYIYPPDGKAAWWARPVPKYFGDGDVWELHNGAGDGGDTEGYLPDVEAIYKYVSDWYDGAPVIVTKDLQ